MALNSFRIGINRLLATCYGRVTNNNENKMKHIALKRIKINMCFLQ